MYEILVKSHSGLRWIVLILMLAAIAKAFMGMRGKKEFGDGDRKLVLFAMISFHVQFLIGMTLYFISPYVSFVEGFMKDATLRFYSVEHISLMIVATALVTIGRRKSNNAEDSASKFKKVAIFYTIALLVVLAAIPWPFRIATAAWF